MTLRTIILTAIAGLLSYAPLAAGQLSPAEALSRAVEARHKNMPSAKIASTASTAASMELKHTFTKDATPTIYLFAPASGRGFMLVSAHDNTQSLLAFSDDATLRADALTANQQWWIDNYSAQIAAADKEVSLASTDVDDSADSLAEIAPLLTTNWAQGDPFNKYCPMLGTGLAPTGCVATALAQCMYHEKWPAKGQGSTSYSFTYNGAKQTLALNYDTIPFDWDNMLAEYWPGEYSDAQADAVARLMQAVGVSVHMQYNPSGSGSDYMTAASALIKYFDYAESVCYYEREYYELNDWKLKIYEELATGHPVPYSGVSASLGHAFVCDGYQPGGYFHFNWGWGGEGNGYYLLSALNPHNARMADDGSFDFEMDQTIITGLRQPSEYVEPAIELRVSGDFSSLQTVYTRSASSDVTFHCQNGIFSIAYAKSVVTLGVRLTDEAGNETYVPASTSHTFAHFSAVQNYKVPTASFPTSGTYEVTPVYRDSIGEWHDVLVQMNKVRSISLDASAVKLTFGKSDDVPNLVFSNPEMLSPIHVGENAGMECTITNIGDEEFFDEVWPVLVRNDSIVAHGPGYELDVPEGDEQTIAVVGTFTAVTGKTLTPGTYRLAVANAVNYAYSIISPSIEVQVLAKSAAPLYYDATSVTISDTPGESTTSTAPKFVSAYEVPMTFNISCRQGYFGQYVGVYVFETDGSRAATGTPTAVLGRRFTGLDGETSKTISFNADLSNLASGTTYEAYPWSSTSGQLSTTPAYFRIGVTGVESVEAPAVGVYPNPCGDHATLECGAQAMKVRVYSVSGTMMPVMWQKTERGAEINTSHLMPGIYILVAETASGGAVQAKIIKK